MPRIPNVVFQIAILVNLSFSYRNKCKIYPHKHIEQKWQRYWLDNKTFNISNDNDTSNESKKYYCLGMIPYPSAKGLHMGHMLSYTGLDIVSRYKRMCGYEVLNPIGWDSFGIPAERCAEEAKRPVQDVVIENINNFKRQLLLMGYSFDWSRVITTSDPNYYKWTQWIFLQMYKKLLVERVSCLVNYCPELGTVLSNEEIINGLSERGGYDVYRKKIPHWIIKITKYSQWLNDNLLELHEWPEKVINAQRNWIGKLDGFLIPFDVIDSDVKLWGFVKNPNELFNCDSVEVSVDFERLDDLVTSNHHDSVMTLVEKCRKLSNIERMRLCEVIDTGRFVKNPINNNQIPIRINSNIIYDVSNSSDNCRIRTREGPIPDGIFEDKFTRHTKFLMRDWIFSRQRRWGEPIPLIESDQKYHPVEDLPYTISNPTETMAQWAGSSYHFVRFIDPENNDSLVSKELAKRWLPVDLYIGGSEHSISHLLYSRFWYKFLNELGLVPNEIPFKKVCLHGMLHIREYIQHDNGNETTVSGDRIIHYKDRFYLKNPDGSIDFGSKITAKSFKMSKSKGNVINPDDLINEYGTDVLRLHLMFLGPFDKDKVWKLEGIIGMQRLLTRIYNLIILNGSINPNIVDIEPNKTYIRETNKLIHGVTNDIERLKFNKSPALFSSYVNFITEYSNGKTPDRFDDYRLIPLKCIKILIKLLNPFSPHLAEELWSVLNSGDKSLSYEEWPKEL